MAYNKFTLRDLKERFGINHELRRFLPTSLPVLTPSAHVLQELADAADVPLATEKAKSEHIVVPIVKELRRRNPERCSYFSGYQFDIDSKRGLSGYCDFIISATPRKLIIEAPIVCFVEAKRDDIDAWFGQCASEMYAAQIFNEREGTPQTAIFGCVTNAFSWAFLKLTGTNLVIDPNYIPLTFTEPHRVIAMLEWILDEVKSEV